MSLLNDMLRDLVNQQQPARQSSAFEQVARREAVFADQDTMTKLIKVLIFFVLVFSSVLLIKHFLTHRPWQWTSTTSQSQSATTIQSRTIQSTKATVQLPEKNSLAANDDHLKTEIEKPAIQSPDYSNQPTVFSNQQTISSNQQANSDMQSLVNTLPNQPNRRVKSLTLAQQESVDNLFAHAKAAIALDRLTSPIEDNAFSDFQAILKIDPQNTKAKESIEWIASRYITLAQEQMKLGNSEQAEAYFQRAEFVAPDYFQSVMASSVGNNLGGVEKKSPEVKPSNKVESVSLASAKETQLAKQQQPSKPQESASAQAISNTEKHTVDETQTQQLSVTPNPIWKDEQAANQARQLFQQNKINDAKNLLLKTLADVSQAPKSVSVLHEIYLQEANYAAADNLVTAAAFLSVDQSTLMRAKSLSAQAKATEAASLLEQHLNESLKNENYISFLANLYHQQARYADSVKLYEVLIKQYGDKAAYWLGLALGMDALSQTKDARAAYQHLKQIAQLQPQVLTYVDKRLAALQVESGAH